nr:putative F-box protein At1g19160 [Ipomoea batatas]
MENCKLPRDLLIEILVRLSVKTLLRFKCVCRFFYDLIRNDHLFMDKHYEFSRAKNNCALLEFNASYFPFNDVLYYLLYKESESQTRCIYLDMPIRHAKSCHGVLCLILAQSYSSLDGDDTERIRSYGMIFDAYALNPSTRQMKALPSIKVPTKPPSEYMLRIGFGFGLSKNKAWKIIMLLRFEDMDSESEYSHQIVMVCSQVEDSWKWRQIDAVHGLEHIPYLNYTRDCYLKGKYYWLCSTDHLIWFDMDDETFGNIKIPSGLDTHFITVMNDTIAVISLPHMFVDDEDFINIWLMDENNNNINWQKHSSIHFDCSITSYWTPVGIWNLGGQLLVFSSDMELQGDVPSFKDGCGPDLISIDLVTQEKKIICTSEVKKSAFNIGFNSGGNAQIFNERNIYKDEEWHDKNIAWYCHGLNPYARDFHESLKFL